MLEVMRLRLRGLVRFVEKTRQNPIYTDFEDTLEDPTLVDLPQVTSGHELGAVPRQGAGLPQGARGPRRASAAAPQQATHPDDLDSLAEMLVASGGDQQVDLAWVTERAGALGPFIRSLVGLDRTAANRGLRELSGRDEVLRRPGALRLADRRRAHRQRDHGAGPPLRVAVHRPRARRRDLSRTTSRSSSTSCATSTPTLSPAEPPDRARHRDPAIRVQLAHPSAKDCRRMTTRPDCQEPPDLRRAADTRIEPHACLRSLSTNVPPRLSRCWTPRTFGRPSTRKDRCALHRLDLRHMQPVNRGPSPRPGDVARG